MVKQGKNFPHNDQQCEYFYNMRIFTLHHHKEFKSGIVKVNQEEQFLQRFLRKYNIQI